MPETCLLSSWLRSIGATWPTVDNKGPGTQNAGCDHVLRTPPAANQCFLNIASSLSHTLRSAITISTRTQRAAISWVLSLLPAYCVAFFVEMDTEKLIEEVRNYPFLYDRGHVDYKNIDKKIEKWREIGLTLNSDGKCYEVFNLLNLNFLNYLF